MRWLDHIPLSYLAVVAILVALLPFTPEPHLWEKLKLFANGTLSRPLDTLDFLMHSFLLLLLLLKLIRIGLKRGATGS
jgi:hypothetical protein